jgi:hypothetical protein
MAWSGDSSKIDVGPGKLWVGKLTAVAPTNSTTALTESTNGGTDGNWVPVGYTEEGSVFSYAVTAESITVAEEIDDIGSRRTAATATLSFSFAEMTARNLLLALNGGLTPSPTSVTPVASVDEVRVSIVLQTDGGARWYFPKAYSQGSIEIQNRKAPQKRLIPVEFKLEKPTSVTNFTVFPASSTNLV